MDSGIHESKGMPSHDHRTLRFFAIRRRAPHAPVLGRSIRLWAHAELAVARRIRARDDGGGLRRHGPPHGPVRAAGGTLCRNPWAAEARIHSSPEMQGAL